MAFVVKLSHI